MIDKKSFQMAESYLRRAKHRLGDAENNIKFYRYAESVSASQECIELSIKAIFLLLQEEYPKRHEFKDEEFIKILENFPNKLKHRNPARLFLISKFWSLVSKNYIPSNRS